VERSKPTDAPPPRGIPNDTAVLVEIRTTVKTIMGSLIPPIADNAKRASEGVIQLLERQQATQRQLDDQAKRLDRLEAAPEEHCLQTIAINEMHHSISALGIEAGKREERLDSLGKWRGYLAAILIPISLAAVGAASAAIADSATQREVMRQHGIQIQTLSNASGSDRQALHDEIKTIPQVVRDIMNDSRNKSKETTLDEAFSKMSMAQQLRLQKLLDEVGIKGR